jgi:hypothetical protein
LFVGEDAATDVANIADLTNTASYSTDAPATIASAVYQVNGSTVATNTTLADGDYASILVTDSNAAARRFSIDSNVTFDVDPTVSLSASSATSNSTVLEDSVMATITLGNTSEAATLSGDDAALFEIVGNQLRAAQDISAYAVYDVTVNIANSRPATASADFTLTVEELVETDLVGTIETTSPSETWTLELRDLGSGSITCDMGDGSGEFTTTDPRDSRFTATYATAGTHTFRLSGDIFQILFTLGTSANRNKLRTITNLGEIGYDSATSAFFDCEGLTSVTFGNTDVVDQDSFAGMFEDNDVLQTVDMTGVTFTSAPQNFARMFNNAFALTNPVGLNEAFATAAPDQMDECFKDVPTAFLNYLNLSGMSIANLSNGGTPGQEGMFDVITSNAQLNQTNFTAMIRAWAQEVQDSALDKSASNGDVILGFGATPIATTGQPDTDVRFLESRGFNVKCGRNAAPEVASAPTAGTPGSSTITVTLPADPFGNGQSVRLNATNGNANAAKARTLEYREDGGSWTEFADDLDAGEAVNVTGLTPEADVDFRAGYRNFDNNAGPSVYSSTVSVTMAASGTTTITVQNIGDDPVITGNGDPTDNVVFTIQQGTFAGTYTQRVTDNALLTIAMIENAPTPLVLPTITGTPNVGQEQVGTPALWLYDGDPLPDAVREFWFGGVATGDVDLSYTPVTSGSLTLRDTFGGVTVESAAVTISAAASAPDAAVDANWTPTTGPTTTPNSVRITIASEPANNGSAITGAKYRVNQTGSLIDIAGYSGPGDYDVPLPLPQTSYDFELVFTNANGDSLPGNVESATSGAGVPAQVPTFIPTTGSGAGEINLPIPTAPADNGSGIIRYEYRLNTGSWQTLTITVPGSATIIAPAEDTDYTASVRAVNAVGPSPAASNPVTSGAAASGITDPSADDANIANWFDFSDASTVAMDSGTDMQSIACKITAGDTDVILDRYGSRPTYNDGVLQVNGLNVAKCENAGSEGLKADDLPWFTGDFSVHMVMEVIDYQDQFSGWFGFDDATTISLDLRTGDNSNNNGNAFMVRGGTTTALTGGPFTGVMKITVERQTADDEILIYVNGALRATIPTTTDFDTTLTRLIFGTNRVNNRWMEAHLCELIVTESMDLRTDYETYFDRWIA